MKRTIKNLLSLLLVFSLCISLNAVPVRAAASITGVVSDNVYENEYFGIRLVLPDGYHFIDDEDVASKSGITVEELHDQDTMKQMMNMGKAPCVCYAYDSTNRNNINISMIHLTSSSEQELATGSRDYLRELYPANGYEVNSVEVEEQEVAGETHYVLLTDIVVSGINCYQASVFFVKDGYCMTIATSANPMEKAKETFSHIEKLN